MFRLALLFMILWMCDASGRAAESPYKLASEARFDLLASPAVGELRDGETVRGSVKIGRMTWTAPAEQPRGYVVSGPVSPRGWREWQIQFVPAKSGEVTLSLRGAWEEVTPKSGFIFRMETLWDAIQVEGAKLPNGSFEEIVNGTPRGWNPGGGSVLEATSETPAADGKLVASTWHNGAWYAKLAVTANQPVRIKASVRAARPPGFVEMARLTDRDSAAHRAAKQFRHGVNFGNYLEVPPDQNWSLPHSVEDVRHAAAEGFDHIRLPIGWHHYASGSDFRLANEIYAKVDSLMAEAVKLKLGVLINIHHYDDLTSKPDDHCDNFLKVWRQLAEHYATQPNSVAFELLNEPKDATTTEVLNPLIAKAIQAIRVSNPKRTIFVPTGRWNSAFELPNLRLPGEDDNLIVTLHCYDPFFFTHQGASWAGPDVKLLSGIRFPGPPDKPLELSPQALNNSSIVDWIKQYNSQPAAKNPCGPAVFQAHIAEAVEWSNYFGRPVHFGEFGCLSNSDPNSRAAYYRLFREQLDQAGIGWAIWDWKAGFKYWDAATNRPAAGMREALFPRLK